MIRFITGQHAYNPGFINPDCTLEPHVYNPVFITGYVHSGFIVQEFNISFTDFHHTHLQHNHRIPIFRKIIGQNK